MTQEHGPGWLSYILVASAALVSGIGFFFSGQWIDGDDPSAKIGLAVFRTGLTLLPALAAYSVASWRQRKLERSMAAQIDGIKALLEEYARLQSVQNELDTIDRLAKVARSAVIQMGTSATELLRTIESIRDSDGKQMLLERYRTHTSNVVTLLNAVGEQVSESGQQISYDLTSDEPIHIVARADQNVAGGLAYAEKIIGSRGIGDGVKQLKSAIERAQDLQKQIASTVDSLSEGIETIDMSKPGVMEVDDAKG